MHARNRWVAISARAWALLTSALIVGGLSGCANGQRFITPPGGSVWLVKVDTDTPPFISAERESLYIVEERVELPIRTPLDEEVAALADVGNASVPWAALPLVRRGDVELQIDWVLSNLSDDAVEVTLIVNGFNQFHEYVPGATVVDDDVVVDFSGWERILALEPRARAQGTVREEELDEVAVDLSTVVNGAPNPQQVVFFQSQSALDPRSAAFIPDVIAGLHGVRIGLLSSAPVPLLLEATVRARDVSGVLVEEDERWMPPAPAPFSPADAAMMMMP